jgi:hypothetical protein
MTNHLQMTPIQQGAASPMSPNDLVQQLVQALGTIAYTQQQILNRLSAAPSTNAASVRVACSHKVDPFYKWADVRLQLDWLERYWLGFNLDGTQKQKLEITVYDIQEHRQIVEAFRQMHNL